MRIPWFRPQRTRQVTLLVTGDGEHRYTLIIEPSGLGYDLRAGERMYLDLDLPIGEEPELFARPGGFSIHVNGRAVTRDRAGEVLDEF